MVPKPLPSDFSKKTTASTTFAGGRDENAKQVASRRWADIFHFIRWTGSSLGVVFYTRFDFNSIDAHNDNNRVHVSL